MAHHFTTTADLKAHIQQLAYRANAVADKKSDERERVAERTQREPMKPRISLENSFIGEDARTAVPLIDSR